MGEGFLSASHNVMLYAGFISFFAALRSCAATMRETTQAPRSLEAIPVKIVPQAKMPAWLGICDASPMKTNWSSGADAKLDIMMRSESGRFENV